MKYFSVILLFSILLCSCNVIYRYAHLDDQVLERKINRKLKGEFVVKVNLDNFKIYSTSEDAKDSVTIKRDCLKGDYSISYRIPDGQILIRLPKDCIDSTIIPEKTGIYSHGDTYTLFFDIRYETFYSHLRLLKICELLSNIANRKAKNLDNPHPYNIPNYLSH